MLLIKNISKPYHTDGNKVVVLGSIRLSVDKYEFVSTISPSDSGKSTSFNTIGIFDGLTDEYYYFSDHAVQQLTEKRRLALYKQYIEFVFQDYYLIDELTKLENTEIQLIYQNKRACGQKASMVDMLGRFQIIGKKDISRVKLSGGEQLVGRARTKSNLVLIDESTVSLNSKQGEESMTIIQVTHSEKNADYGSRIVYLLDGMIASNKNT